MPYNSVGFILIKRYRDIYRTFVDITIIATLTCQTISRVSICLTRALIAGTDRIHSTNARTHALRPTRCPFDKQCRTAIIISTTVISCRLKGTKKTAKGNRASCTVLSVPPLAVPCLVSPFTNIVTAAVACLDTYVWAGERARSIGTVGAARRPAGSRKSRVISALLRPHTAL